MEKIKRLLLVGGGHTHIFLIKQFCLNPIPGFEVLLVSDSNYQYYSGMAAGYVEGFYNLDEISFDLKKMCKHGGVEFIHGRITGIDAQNRCVTLESNEIVYFDILSVDTGSDMAGKSVHGVLKYACCIKPLENLFTLRGNFMENIANGSQVVIAGAGAAGIEMAFALKVLSDKIKKNIKITLVHSGNLILKGYHENVREITLRMLSKDKIEVLSNHKILRISEKNIFMESGKQIKYDFLIWAAGPKANPLYKASGFKVDADGYMMVNSYLQSVDYDFVFGAGDCISFYEFSYVKKVGVYAIREAPHLYNNILKFIRNDGLKEYIPQKNYMAIISSGNKKGIMQYKGMAISGGACWKLKDFIDCKFMKKFKFY
ncbi:FAD-dependent oxidoreductase [Clostridium tagluense]|uniref:FAD-dependent oxidoreductase n=1 Tax=Clostridium tagluense TaxID=360422 RepID=UPI001CF34DE4|nr:FAD-dependent oxidoreductase [Clostridium tagluense]MCB2313567.1 FAD-dependent oxidoreductase [Clostridium tagluense]MCB2318431.1 FAD-dependent oxidoreductase [Clostridium tagluense]MCB2323232.1 FAD-dependent oxidoreductase [Clostridium tagluense]MCB2328175.1 FAD-dependent oxidoreductase [Clostridium tagluense]MCB2332960.1 FAD-dependent oxidoreductase [Clostridium tagluense]